MSAALSIINEVESALHEASGEKRVEVLRRVTDLFVGNAENYSEAQTALFDGVMGQLVTHIESRAAAELSRRLADLANAPHDTVQHLARHDDVEVAGPVLTRSPRLTDNDIIEIAKLKSQAHLAKIASRPRLSAMVTDVLVDFGDSNVANQLASNAGAELSKGGMAKLVLRADGDDRLTETMAGRKDIPPRLFQQLLAQATEVVRKKMLVNADHDKQEMIKRVLADISKQVAPKPISAQGYARAHGLMNSYSQDTELLKTKILEFANGKRVAETVTGLAMLSQTPHEQVERLFFSSSALGITVLCKATAFDWTSTEMVIGATPTGEKYEQAELDEIQEQFEALSLKSAQRLLRFWQGRQAVIKAMAQKSA